MNRRTARRAPTAPPPAAPVYLGYEALIRHHQLRVPPLRSVSVAVDRTVERHIIAADGQERVELPLRRVADTESLAARLTFALKREPLNLAQAGRKLVGCRSRARRTGGQRQLRGLFGAPRNVMPHHLCDGWCRGGLTLSA